MRLLFHFLQVVAVLVVVAGDLSLFVSTVFFPFLLRPSLVQQLTPRLCYVTRHKRAHQFSVYTTDNIRHGTLVILMRKWTSPGDWRRPRPVLFLPPSGRLSLFFTCPPMLEIERFLIPPSIFVSTIRKFRLLKGKRIAFSPLPSFFCYSFFIVVVLLVR